MLPPSLRRSRIRRRSFSSCGGNHTVNNSMSSPSSSTAWVHLASVAATTTAALLLLLLSPVEAYLGPTHCVKQGTTAAAAVMQSTTTTTTTTMGYSTFNHLLFDMVSLASSFKSGRILDDDQLTFTICPGSIIDLDDSSMPLGFLPIEVPRLTLQCGDGGKRGSAEKGTACIIRGGGKRDPTSKTWNTKPNEAYKDELSGIVGGGTGSVAQIYVYGESAYEITLRGLTFDNSLSKEEQRLYESYMKSNNYGSTGDGSAAASGNREKEMIEEEFDESIPNSSSTSTNDQLQNNRDKTQRRQQQQQQSGGSNASQNLAPAHRFASLAVRGKGYGDDAGPRLITIENCRFEYHRGYAILVSPGIQQPNLPAAPEFDFPASPSSSSSSNNNNMNNNVSANSQAASELAASMVSSEGDKGVEDIMANVNVQSSAQIYNKENGKLLNNNDNGGGASAGDGDNEDDGQFRRRRQRRLNLLENGGKFIPPDGMVSYYDHTAGKNYHDGRRVKIIKSEFANNIVSGDTVAGLITSAYSLTLTDCFFQKNSGKAMVFVYNNEALVDNTIFAENTVEVSTIIMASPKGSKPLMTAIKSNGELARAEPTHIVERTCFLGSHVGMSNVLVTDVENTGFGQRDNHAKSTEFTWVSNCEGAAAEQLGNDCLETGNCDGTCVRFTSEECLADRVDTKEYDMFFNAAGYYSGGKIVWRVGTVVGGMMLGVWLI